MQEKVLTSYETFEEFPDGVVEIRNNTNLIYIQLSSEIFIAREFLKKAEGDESNVECIIDYKNIIDGKVILTIHIMKNKGITNVNYLNETNEIPKIIPLCKLLSIKENSTYYMGLEDINNLIKSKTKIRN